MKNTNVISMYNYTLVGVVDISLKYKWPYDKFTPIGLLEYAIIDEEIKNLEYFYAKREEYVAIVWLNYIRGKSLYIKLNMEKNCLEVYSMSKIKEPNGVQKVIKR